MEFQKALECLSTQIGIERWEPDEDGLYQLDYDERLTLTAFSPPESAALYLVSSLIAVPEHVPASFFQRLLQMNFMLLDTRGAALGIDDEGRQVHLGLSVPLALVDENKLPDLFSGFLETSLEIQAQLRGETSAGESELSASHSGLLNFQRV
jgi:hypothetical protein